MEYQIIFDSVVEKQLKKLDKRSQKQIINFIEDLLIKINDDGISPYLLGKALMGNMKGLYRFRTGDYRLIAKIQDKLLTIHILKIGHRKDIYS